MMDVAAAKLLPTGRSKNPNGISPHSPGLGGTSYPGWDHPISDDNPNEVAVEEVQVQTARRFNQRASPSVFAFDVQILRNFPGILSQ